MNSLLKDKSRGDLHTKPAYQQTTTSSKPTIERLKTL